MRTLISTARAVVVALSLGVALTSGACAPLTTIGFDELAPGAQVSNQYQMQGVEFFRVLPEVAARGDAPSPGNVASLRSPPYDFTFPSLWVRLSKPARKLAMRLATTSRIPVEVRLTARDAAGGELTYTKRTINSESGYVPIEVQHFIAAIASFDLIAPPYSTLFVDDIAILVP